MTKTNKTVNTSEQNNTAQSLNNFNYNKSNDQKQIPGDTMHGLQGNTMPVTQAKDYFYELTKDNNYSDTLCIYGDAVSHELLLKEYCYRTINKPAIKQLFNVSNSKHFLILLDLMTGKDSYAVSYETISQRLNCTVKQVSSALKSNQSELISVSHTLYRKPATGHIGTKNHIELNSLVTSDQEFKVRLLWEPIVYLLGAELNPLKEYRNKKDISYTERCNMAKLYIALIYLAANQNRKSVESNLEVCELLSWGDTTYRTTRTNLQQLGFMKRVTLGFNNPGTKGSKIRNLMIPTAPDALKPLFKKRGAVKTDQKTSETIATQGLADLSSEKLVFKKEGANIINNNYLINNNINNIYNNIYNESSNELTNSNVDNVISKQEALDTKQEQTKARPKFETAAKDVIQQDKYQVDNLMELARYDYSKPETAYRAIAGCIGTYGYEATRRILDHLVNRPNKVYRKTFEAYLCSMMFKYYSPQGSEFGKDVVCEARAYSVTKAAHKLKQQINNKFSNKNLELANKLEDEISHALARHQLSSELVDFRKGSKGYSEAPMVIESNFNVVIDKQPQKGLETNTEASKQLSSPNVREQRKEPLAPLNQPLEMVEPRSSKERAQLEIAKAMKLLKC